MSFIPEEMKYTMDHVWIRMEDDFTATCGITDYAQEKLSDIIYVALPDKDMEVDKGEQVAEVESDTDVSNICSPVSGRITKINYILEDTPKLVNSDPYTEGWIFEIEIKDLFELNDLMDIEDYTSHIEFGD